MCKRVLRVVLLAVAAAGLGSVAACRRESSPSVGAPPAPPSRQQVQITRPVAGNNEVVLKPETVDIPSSGDPLASTLTKLLETATDDRGRSAIPNGTRLLGVKVEGGAATVNLSADFNRVNRMGDTGESLALNALRKALAQFPGVKTMTVQVEGKTFAGSHTDEWADIPVREESSGGSL